MKIGIIAAMSSEYKQVAQLLEEKKEYILKVLTLEEEKFNKTIDSSR